MTKMSRCDRCGETVHPIDAGFSPGRHQMQHGSCGGTWVEVEIEDETEVEPRGDDIQQLMHNFYRGVSRDLKPR